MATLRLDPKAEVLEQLKPIHGVGQPPMLGSDHGMFHYLTEAGIPFSRLHDVAGAYGGGVYVDIPNIFRNFDADENDPASYDFPFTDHLIKGLLDAKVEPYFRLGVTIENDAYIKPYRIFPPKDNLKWAKICEHIIAHYTEGWADGFFYPIRYWEIWNEPDGEPDGETDNPDTDNQNWKGTRKQFFELYATASKHLKNRFPHLMIGGYGSCGFYDLKKSYISEANSSPRFEYFITFMNEFLAYIKERDCPLDFFSWHSYDSPENNLIYARYCKEKLVEAGYPKAETHCNEWNYQSRDRGTPRHASLTAAMLIAFQESPLDVACFYDARIGVSRFGSLFHPMTKEPLKAYYSFICYNELYQKKNRIPVEGELPPCCRALAARGEDGTVSLLVVNPTTEKMPLTLSTSAEIKGCRIIDEQFTLREISLPEALPPYSVVLLDLE